LASLIADVAPAPQCGRRLAIYHGVASHSIMALSGIPSGARGKLAW
jgi:hypothetical protein